VEVADIVRAQGDRFVARNRSWLSYQQLAVLRALSACRTSALGGHVDRCSSCGYQAISYNSCRNRHCPKCQAQARERWLAAREQELLGVSYFHVVFTLPQLLNALCKRNAKVLYNLLFRASAETMLELAADQKHLGAEIGFLSILHTWGQNLSLHPHVHCVVPAGGLSPDHRRWIHPKYRFFFPVKVLARIFRQRFVRGLRGAYRRNQLAFGGETAALADAGRFQAFLNTLFRQDWIVYAKPSLGGPRTVLRYLGRYTQRVAISNHRLLAFDGERVTFRWKDYAHGNQHRTMSLPAPEFLRRFLQHVLPRGFVRIRQFGYLASPCRTARLALARRLLDFIPAQETAPTPAPTTTWNCPRCGSPMQIGPNLTGAELALRCTFFDSS
jgi:Putative transposase/Transposase zinc-binding domain